MTQRTSAKRRGHSVSVSHDKAAMRSYTQQTSREVFVDMVLRWADQLSNLGSTHRSNIAISRMPFARPSCALAMPADMVQSNGMLAHVESCSRVGVWSDLKLPFNVKPGEFVELSTTSWISFVKGS